jgi:SAM-dependent methyltransferase
MPPSQGPPRGPERYDTIGRGYAAFRRSDPHIAAQIWAAVGDADRIVNVGAGTGSYELPDRHIVAVEPSGVMVRQRGPASAPVIRAVAESLPFADRSFDVAMAMLTVHHWTDLAAGLVELRRVADRQVIFTFDPSMHDALWGFHEYATAALGFADDAPLTAVTDALGPCRVEVVPIPADCTDGFASAYWRRPEQYLSPTVRAGISAFARLDAADIEPGLARLEEDLASGRWHERHADLLQLDAIDAGLRLIIAG